MSAVTITVDIDAAPAKVFGVLRDVEQWPRWTPTIVSVERVDRTPFTLGSRARVSQPKLRTAVWTVTEYQEQRNFTWCTRGPGFSMRASHLVEPREAGSRVALTFEVSGLLSGLIRRLYGRLIEEYVRTESRALKLYCERVNGLQPVASE
jgi:carbon monoxide dehydrogenase subunit G